MNFATVKGLTIPVMTKRVKVINLVPAMSSLSFEVRSSSGACEMSTAHSKYGSTALCNIGVSGYNEMYSTTTTKFKLIPDHFYYACVEVYQETKLGSIDYFWPSGSPSMFGGKATGDAGTWKKWDNVTTRSTFSEGEYPIRLDFNNGGTAGKAWYDGLMLIDLTEAFGAGNEPGYSWCANNIPYFTGTTTMDIPVSSPIQASVTEIKDASGRVLWSATIKFTINGDTYIADRGMTWAEWFASDYNTTGETKGTITDSNGNEVSMDAVIVGGAVYEIGFGSGEATLTVDIGVPDSSGYSASVIINAPFPNNGMSAMMGMVSEPPVTLSGGMSGSWSYPVPVGTVIEFNNGTVYLNGTQQSMPSYVVKGNVTIKTSNVPQKHIYITEE